MFGTRNAVRAAWASLFKAKSWTGVRVGEEHLTRSEGVSYVSVHSPTDRNTLHTIVIHPHATRQGGSFRKSFLQLGPNAENRFFVRLTRECPVPMRTQWRDEIWRMGIEKRLIVLLNGFGLPLYEVKTEGDLWAEIVRDALVEGRIG